MIDEVVALEIAIANFVSKVKHLRELYPKKEKPAAKS